MTIPTTAIRVLRDYFGLETFRPGQAEVVAAQMEGRDVLSVAPTGSGKSVSYWVPAVAGGGLTIVVSPLIALMKDQVDRLHHLGIPATFINSSLTRAEQVDRLHRASGGEYRLLYLAPERFARPGFLDRLAAMSVRCLVVDEAHCISTWGHDFRREYRRLGQALEACGRPPVAAFTATATPPVRDDIARSLALRDPLVSVTGFNRPNLRLEVRRCRGEGQKLEALKEALAGPGRAIVYTGTVRSVEEVAQAISGQGRRVAAYHGRLADQTRRAAQNDFASGKAEVMVATSAFGMGVDIPDIRSVVHYHLPGGLEAYYQEAGRAGRDGEPASCMLLYSPADRDLQAFFIERAHPEASDVVATYQVMRRAGFWSLDPEELRTELPDRALRSLEATRLLLESSNLLNPDGSVALVERLEIDFGQLAQLKRHAYSRLNQMIAYAEQRSCRHARIADYFGEGGAASNCSACDNCLVERPPEVRVEPEAVRAALTCVARFNGRLGAVNLASILRGRDNRWTRAQSWVRNLPFHGALSDWSEETVRGLLGELVASGCAIQATGEYPVLQLTSLGRDVINGAATVTITLPEPNRRKSRAAPHPGPANDHASDPDLVSRLRQWRLETARRHQVPAYVVFPDKTMVQLAAQLPRTRAELLEVPGIGPAKLERYGDDLLALLTSI